MLTRIILSAYGAIIEISLWIILITAILFGWKTNGPIGALIAATTSFISCATIFGACLMLEDIWRTLSTLEKIQLDITKKLNELSASINIGHQGASPNQSTPTDEANNKISVNSTPLPNTIPTGVCPHCMHMNLNTDKECSRCGRSL